MLSEMGAAARRPAGGGFIPRESLQSSRVGVPDEHRRRRARRSCLVRSNFLSFFIHSQPDVSRAKTHMDRQVNRTKISKAQTSAPAAPPLHLPDEAEAMTKAQPPT